MISALTKNTNFPNDQGNTNKNWGWVGLKILGTVWVNPQFNVKGPLQIELSKQILQGLTRLVD